MKTILYLGLSPPSQNHENTIIHCPLIEIVPRGLDDVGIQKAFGQIEQYTHLIFTSQNAVNIFCDFLKILNVGLHNLKDKIIIAIGPSTREALEKQMIVVDHIPEKYTQEGIIDYLKTMNLDNSYFFWPHAALSRPNLTDYFIENKVRYCSCAIYDTFAKLPRKLPSLDIVDEIVFTSPSIVDAFIQFYGYIPLNKKLVTIGPITEARLKQNL